MLGLIVEEVIDGELSEFVKTSILDPLDMKNSRYEYTEEGNVMTPYMMMDRMPKPTLELILSITGGYIE